MYMKFFSMKLKVDKSIIPSLSLVRELEKR